MTDMPRERTLSATPEVTGPEGSFEMGDPPEQYQCFLCFQTFDKGQTDEEALAEYHEKFGDAERAPGEVCEECYEKVLRFEAGLPCGAERMGYVCARKPGHELPSQDTPDPLHAAWCGQSEVMIAFWSDAPDAGPGVRVRSIGHAAHHLIQEIAKGEAAL
jgi:hypothetical protein